LPSTNKIQLGLNQRQVSALLLDSENPRLPPDVKSYSQQELCKHYEKHYDLFPVAMSMADNGYFQEEPLIGIRGPDNKVIVIEGNRRLATLKFLTEPETRELSSKKIDWEKLFQLSAKNGHNLTLVPVVVHESRDELRAILGFRHITGIMKWDALAKARFVNNLVEERKDADFYAIGREVGARQDTIRSNYVAYRVCKQAKEEFNIDTSEVEKRFGVFYTALNNVNIREYIGLDMDKSRTELRRPISSRKADELRNFIEYLQGTSEIEPVFTDSRNISKLGEILAVPEARKVLQTTRNFRLAYRSTGGEERTLIGDLERASISLIEAYKTIYLHCENQKVTQLIERCIGTMNQILRSCPQVKAKIETE
jgi:hypothetical protein